MGKYINLRVPEDDLYLLTYKDVFLGKEDVQQYQQAHEKWLSQEIQRSIHEAIVEYDEDDEEWS